MRCSESHPLYRKSKKSIFKNDYIDVKSESESVSKSLEYAYNDWCIAQVIQKYKLNAHLVTKLYEKMIEKIDKKNIEEADKRPKIVASKQGPSYLPEL
jgi:putative alpha-1,2-mannosidase